MFSFRVKRQIESTREQERERGSGDSKTLPLTTVTAPRHVCKTVKRFCLGTKRASVLVRNNDVMMLIMHTCIPYNFSKMSTLRHVPNIPVHLSAKRRGEETERKECERQTDGQLLFFFLPSI